MIHQDREEYERSVNLAALTFIRALHSLESEAPLSSERYWLAAKALVKLDDNLEVANVQKKFLQAFGQQIESDERDRSVHELGRPNASKLLAKRVCDDLHYLFVDSFVGENVHEAFANQLIKDDRLYQAVINAISANTIADLESKLNPGGALLDKYAVTGSRIFGATGAVVTGHTFATRLPVAIKCVWKIPKSYSSAQDGQDWTYGRVEVAGRTVASSGFSNILDVSALTPENLCMNEVRCLLALPSGPWPRCLDVAFHNGVGFLVMDKLEGTSLDKVIRDRGAMGRKQAIWLMVQILEALEIVHEHGWLHGDVKPSNIILESDYLKLIDFGAAVELKDDNEHFRFGTPDYCAPEALDKMYLPYRPSADVFGAFSVGLECLLGVQNFRKTRDMLDVDKNSLIQELGGRDLLDVFRIGLSENPDRRFQTAKAASIELLRLN